MLSERAAGTDLVVNWLEGEVQAGRLTVGGALPSEREIGRRLRVSRIAIREAKAFLRGRGVLVQERMRAYFVRRDGASLFSEWVRRVSESNHGDLLRRVREALQLRRLVLPEATSLAVRHATSTKLTELVDRYADLELHIASKSRPHQLAAVHHELLFCSAHLSGSSVLVALGAGLAEALAPLPIWDNVHNEREQWSMTLREVNALLKDRKASKVRTALRKHLGTLDKNFCDLIVRSAASQNAA